ncbi:DUF4350 domain-containing protein [Phenylobacterium sp.]|uniref:DUF4350 domain-containing protein n=1 Tax=Phenylobacterium sp. TaxID=1871053 RepID=UPI0025F82466|nr:DUF4350 domain-containing protein [Phenylobacterium sp.]
MAPRMPVAFLSALALLAAPGPAWSQAVANSETDLSVAHPAYPTGAGPVVALDEGHHNYHTLEGRYAPFAAVLRHDGYRVSALRGEFSAAKLSTVRVLVIANALAPSNAQSWKLPTPSAFAPAEIAAVQAWVKGGGALFLIADHMPFAGAATDLAKAFDFAFENVAAVKGDGRTPEIFTPGDGTLVESPITRGSGRAAPVSEAQTFTGSAFRAPAGAIPILRLDEGWALLYPSEWAKFDPETPRRAATRDDLRAAALVYGKGRIVVVSEAAMFTNQLVKGAPYGFGQPSARQDKQLLLNIVEWLTAR